MNPSAHEHARPPAASRSGPGASVRGSGVTSSLTQSVPVAGPAEPGQPDRLVRVHRAGGVRQQQHAGRHEVEDVAVPEPVEVDPPQRDGDQSRCRWPGRPRASPGAAENLPVPTSSRLRQPGPGHDERVGLACRIHVVTPSPRGHYPDRVLRVAGPLPASQPATAGSPVMSSHPTCGRAAYTLRVTGTALADPLPGTVLDRRYRIDAPIARGGMSTVYAGTDLRLDRRVAVKVMAPALAHDPAFTERFVREARTAARLSHPNAVAVFDQGAEDTRAGRVVFLVMELVPGSTLREVLHRRGRLRPDEAVSVLEPVLAALAAAHRAGLVHRDVKPENVLVSADGTVKVVDFGLARAVAAPSTSTQSGMVLGTVAYVSPEQVARGVSDARTDVYSAGVVLFELLTGTPPYGGDVGPRGRLPARARRRAGAVHPGGRDPAGAGRAGAAGDPAGAGRPARRCRRLPGRAGHGPHRPRAAPGAVPGGRQCVRDRGADRPGRSGRGAPGRPRRRCPRPRATTALPAYAQPVQPPGRPRRGASRVGPADGSGWPAERRRRRTWSWVALAVVLLAALSVGTVAWWFGSGRFAAVPSLTQLTRAQAEARLDGVDLTARFDQEPSETVAAGRVVRSEPAPGGRVLRGHSVTVVLSSGPPAVPVPSVTGQSADDAQGAIRQAGLQPQAHRAVQRRRRGRPDHLADPGRRHGQARQHGRAGRLHRPGDRRGAGRARPVDRRRPAEAVRTPASGSRCARCASAT